MDRMTIDNQKHLAARLPDQAAQESEQHLPGESLLEHHESQPPQIADGGDHVAAKSLSGAGDDRRFAFPTVARAGLMIAAQTHLVALENLGPLPLGTPSNGRILLAEPTLDSHRIPLVRPAQRFLWREAPLVQVSPTVQTDNRMSYRSAINWATASRVHRADGNFSWSGQRSTIIRTTVAAWWPAKRERLGRPRGCEESPAALEIGQPRMNRRPRHTEGPRSLGFRHSLLVDRSNNTPPQVFLGRWRQATRIRNLAHARSYDSQTKVFSI